MKWQSRINRARNNNGTFTREDNVRAESWPSCAVAERPGTAVDKYSSAPRDQELFDLGMLFLEAVYYNSVENAQQALDLILAYEEGA